MAFDAKKFKQQVKEDLAINEHDLQGEWARQPNLFMHYSMKMSSLIKKKELLRADLANEILSNPSDFGIEKLSEAAINRAIESNEDFIDLDYQVALHSNAVKAFEHKKRALEYDCQLMIGGFFSEPREKKPIKKKG